MEEVRLAQTSVRGHRPKERMPALIGECEEFLQFSTQQPFQTLAGSLAMGKTELPDYPIRLFPVFSMPLAIGSLSATQNRNLLVRNSSPRQKVHGDQGDPISLAQAVIFKESDGGNRLQFKRTWDITNPLNLVMLETLSETFTTQAMWLIVQAMLSLSVGPNLESPTLMEPPTLMKMSTTQNLSVGNTTGTINENRVEQKKQKTRSEQKEQGFADIQVATLILLFLADLRMKTSTVLAMVTNEEATRMTERTRKMMSLSSLLQSEQTEQVNADLCQATHSSMSIGQQAFPSGAYSARSGMDINCTMTEMAREKGTTLNDLNTGRVIEVAV